MHRSTVDLEGLLRALCERWSATRPGVVSSRARSPSAAAAKIVIVALENVGVDKNQISHYFSNVISMSSSWTDGAVIWAATRAGIIRQECFTNTRHDSLIDARLGLVVGTREHADASASGVTDAQT